MRAVADDLLALVARCTPLLLALSAERAAHRPAPGKWSPREILGHLIDSAGNNQQKFVRMQTGGPAIAFVGYAQDAWVAAQRYQDADWAQVVRWWQGANEHLAHVIAVIDPACHGHTIAIDGHGPFRLDFIVPDYVEHQRHHLRQALPDAGITSAFQNVYGA